MVDISVNNLTKFFVIGENLLQGQTFDIQEGECVAILGRNGCGKTTLFKILTGEMDYDDGQVYVNPNKRIGLISQIPKFPAGYTVEDVLRSAYTGLMNIKAKMEALEQAMSAGATADQLREYDNLTNRFQSGGGQLQRRRRAEHVGYAGAYRATAGRFSGRADADRTDHRRRGDQSGDDGVIRLLPRHRRALTF